MKQISLLYILCILARLIIIIIAYFAINYDYYYYIFTWFYYLLGIGSLYHWITNARKNGGFNQSIWWHYLRPVHGTLYILAAYFIYRKNLLFIPTLLVDTLFSIYGHLQYHYF